LVIRSLTLLLALAAAIGVVQTMRAFAEPLRPIGGYPSATPYSAAGCAVTHVGIDTVGANSVKLVFDGRGEGQVVDLQDTFVAAFTVYRAAFEDSIPYQVRLFVTNSDLNGRPVASSVIYAGPIFYGGFGDGIHPFPLVFEINPPLALPHRGLYYFNVTESSCFFGNFVLLADTRNLYPAGGEWKTGESLCDLYPGSIEGVYTTTDLIFDVAVCSAVTPARQETWGQLKVIYR
jgi:hypothetical protein